MFFFIWWHSSYSIQTAMEDLCHEKFVNIVPINIWSLCPLFSAIVLWKMVFISSKKHFSFSRYSFFLFLSFPLFLPAGHYFGGWSKINLKVQDVINCLNKNSITHFAWYPEKEKRYDIETLSIDRVSDNEHFHRKMMQKMCSKS